MTKTKTAQKISNEAIWAAVQAFQALREIIQTTIDHSTAALVADRDHWQSEALNLRKLCDRAVKERDVAMAQVVALREELSIVCQELTEVCMENVRDTGNPSFATNHRLVSVRRVLAALPADYAHLTTIDREELADLRLAAERGIPRSRDTAKTEGAT